MILIHNIISMSREYIHISYQILFFNISPTTNTKTYLVPTRKIFFMTFFSTYLPIILDFMLDSCLKQKMHIISYHIILY